MSIGKLIIAGGSGLIGKALVSHFKDKTDEIVVLTRSESSNTDSHRKVKWDAKSGGDWQREFDNCDVLINLTGKSIQCRFTDKNRVLLYSSRIDSTKILSETISQASAQPKVWLNASGSAYYPASEQAYSEDDIQSPIDFLGRLCFDWESELMKDKNISSRRVAMRISPVLDSNEGALMPAKMAAKFGAGGAQGSGRQFVSWIHIKDIVRAIEFIINDSSLQGPVNLCSPSAIRNKEYMKAVRSAVGMPIGLPAPRFLIKLTAPIIGVEPILALESKHIIPKRLSEAGFKFKFPEIDAALLDLL
jgi:uncharacterized protein (TIGR01777 family)